METVKLTCVECPMGCAIEVGTENGKAVSVTGNGCPRGKKYAENEVVCPRRVVTTTVRTSDGRMLPIKTSSPVRRSEIFAVMEKINACVAIAPVRIGDVILDDVDEGISVVATADLDRA